MPEKNIFTMTKLILIKCLGVITIEINTIFYIYTIYNTDIHSRYKL